VRERERERERDEELMRAGERDVLVVIGLGGIFERI
jgi:hypothetical protein